MALRNLAELHPKQGDLLLALRWCDQVLALSDPAIQPLIGHCNELRIALQNTIQRTETHLFFK